MPQNTSQKRLSVSQLSTQQDCLQLPREWALCICLVPYSSQSMLTVMISFRVQTAVCGMQGVDSSSILYIKKLRQREDNVFPRSLSRKQKCANSLPPIPLSSLHHTFHLFCHFILESIPNRPQLFPKEIKVKKIINLIERIRRNQEKKQYGTIPSIKKYTFTHICKYIYTHTYICKHIYIPYNNHQIYMG